MKFCLIRKTRTKFLNYPPYNVVTNQIPINKGNDSIHESTYGLPCDTFRDIKRKTLREGRNHERRRLSSTEPEGSESRDREVEFLY